MRFKELTLAGWGRVDPVTMNAARPERQAEVDRAFAAATAIAPRGAGRAYGDAAVARGGTAILTQRLDRVLEFDAATGRVVAEPGVTFADLARVFLPRGFMAPTSPGTAFASIGGAIATDAHGKNHDRHGSFGDAVRWIDLLTADGITRRVSPESDPALFAATIGGMGMTGLIRRACFDLLPGSPFVTVKSRRMGGLDEFIAGLLAAREATFSVGWIDVMAAGADFARGILETAEPAPMAPMKALKAPRSVPIDFPGFALHPAAVRLFNQAYFHRVPARGRERVMALTTFLYPLDALANWNRIYGKRGFYQFQCVVPDEAAAAGLREILGAIRDAGTGSFLAVLKTLGRAGRGDLSFPMRGFTLALDFPRRAGVEALITRLIDMTIAHAGRVYLAKDQLMTAAQARAMYPRADAFAATLARVDPQARFTTELGRRLGFKPRARIA